jgi:predicted DNA-binding transcriptional regulator YafY
VNYQISLSAAELKVIGDGLDLLPHGKAQAVVQKIQAQIDAQEKAARDRAQAEQAAAFQSWREDERKKLLAELNDAPAEPLAAPNAVAVS